MEALWTYVLAACGGISCVAAALNWIIKGYKAAKAPDEQQNARLQSLENKSDGYDAYFADDKKRLDKLEEGNRITQRALLALLSHGIDGNDVQAMQDSKKELQEFLIKS